jgi:uncharacterized SAM-binding protein YcdF (DUF218 family)
MLLTPLEQRFPEMQYPDQNIEGIIVLGGSYDSVSHSYASVFVLDEDTAPMAVMANLARRYPRAKIIFSGGTHPTSGPGPDEASIVKGYFESLGIAGRRIFLEDKSLTTEENAKFTARMLQPSPTSRWLLVTSAYHMPRAMGAFRKAGFDVLPFSTGERTHGWYQLWRPSSTATENLRRLDTAVHEWIGLFAYRLLGYSDSWFPGPRDDERPRNQVNVAPAGARPGSKPPVRCSVRVVSAICEPFDELRTRKGAHQDRATSKQHFFRTMQNIELCRLRVQLDRGRRQTQTV